MVSMGVGAERVLRAVAAAHTPVKALFLALELGGSWDDKLRLLQSGAATFLAQMHTLMLCTSGPRATLAIMEPLAQLLQAGQLPALKRVMLALTDVDPPALFGQLQPALASIVGAGCSMHLLPWRWYVADAPAFRQLREAMPRPDLLQLGVHKEEASHHVI